MGRAGRVGAGKQGQNHGGKGSVCGGTSSWEVARAARDRCLLWLCKSRWATGITQTTVASCRAGGGGHSNYYTEPPVAAAVPRSQSSSCRDRGRGNGARGRSGREQEEGSTALGAERHHQKIFLDLNCLGKEDVPRQRWEPGSDPPARLGGGQSPRRAILPGGVCNGHAGCPGIGRLRSLCTRAQLMGGS